MEIGLDGNGTPNRLTQDLLSKGFNFLTSFSHSIPLIIYELGLD